MGSGVAWDYTDREGYVLYVSSGVAMGYELTLHRRAIECRPWRRYSTAPSIPCTEISRHTCSTYIGTLRLALLVGKSVEGNAIRAFLCVTAYLCGHKCNVKLWKDAEVLLCTEGYSMLADVLQRLADPCK